MKKLRRETTPETWPKTVEEVAQLIIENLEEEDEQYIGRLEKDDMIQFHHTLGASIRSAFGLWWDNEPLRRDCDRISREYFGSPPAHPNRPPLIHADTASSVILKRVWEILQEKEPL